MVAILSQPQYVNAVLVSYSNAWAIILRPSDFVTSTTDAQDTPQPYIMFLLLLNVADNSFLFEVSSQCETECEVVPYKVNMRGAFKIRGHPTSTGNPAVEIKNDFEQECGNSSAIMCWSCHRLVLSHQ